MTATQTKMLRTGATTLRKEGTLGMNFQAVRIPTTLLIPLFLVLVTYLVVFLYLHSAVYTPFPLELFGNRCCPNVPECVRSRKNHYVI